MQSIALDAEKLVDIMDAFLETYVDDDTIVENEFLESEAVGKELYKVTLLLLIKGIGYFL